MHKIWVHTQQQTYQPEFVHIFLSLIRFAIPHSPEGSPDRFIDFSCCHRCFKEILHVSNNFYTRVLSRTYQAATSRPTMKDRKLTHMITMTITSTNESGIFWVRLLHPCQKVREKAVIMSGRMFPQKFNGCYCPTVIAMGARMINP